MSFLAVERIVKHFGPQPVLDGVTFEMRPADKIGIVGPNGTGKTTLLRIVAGELGPDAGTVSLSGKVRVGYLSQNARCEGDERVFEVALSGAAHILALRDEAQCISQEFAGEGGERKQLEDRYERLQHELLQHDAYNLENRVVRILQGLGFAEERFETPARLLSGGQQNRLMLARMLAGDPDLLVLDEPSNHLDIAATEWLENFLASSRKAVLIVSHDRYLLDKVCNRVLELLHGTVDDYKGNFSAYWRQKAERLEVQRRTYARQQEAIAKMEDFVRRNIYGQKSAQAQDRRKKLERIERVPLPREIKSPTMHFPAVTRAGDIVLRVEKISKSFTHTLFSDLSFDVLRGERWGVMGANGTGKTTLLKCCLGREPLRSGSVTLGTGVKVAYFDQSMQSIPDDAIVVDVIRPDHKEFAEPARRDLLARFGITGDMVFEKVSTLSGGERSRVALARLAAQDANLLVLDEPTNHLDLWARDAIEMAIKEFTGTAILVSHDRYLLNRVVDHLLVFEVGRVSIVEGNYETYLHLQESRGSDSVPDAGRNAEPTKQQGRGPTPSRARKRRFPYRKVKDIEQDIEQHEREVEQLHAMLADPDVLRDGNRVKQAMEKLQTCQTALEQLLAHWEEAIELSG